jgi:hypothetical protein
MKPVSHLGSALQIDKHQRKPNILQVLQCILDVHEYRKATGEVPGEVVLLSASPGKLMARLVSQIGRERMSTARATRVDYYTMHDADLWQDQLGSIGLGSEDSVFCNLAGVAGPVPGRPNAMQAVNYSAPLAAARACQNLGFGHWIQSSTQATKAERAGQVLLLLLKKFILMAITLVKTLICCCHRRR